ncbi:MAG: hypothetical protein L6R45_07170 [Anaerolineae bacterium]|nr:hypothetical protein [Anaerolineae bacterium]
MMKQQPPAKKPSDPRQARAERWLASAMNSPHQRPLMPLEPERSAAPYLVGGFLLLQIIALLAALLILLPSQPATPQPVGVILPTPTLTVPIQTILPPPSTPTPPTLQPSSPPTSQLPNLPTLQPSTPPTLPPPPISLKLRGVEITQGIQVFNEPELSPCQPDPYHPAHIFCNNSIPLVAGRHTLVRVYPSCGDTCPGGDVIVRLRLLKDGQEQANLTRLLPAATLQRLNSLTLPNLRQSLDNSINFEFFPPPAWMTGQITFVLETLPQDQPDQASVTLTLTKDFATRKSLRIAYLPIAYQGVTPPDMPGIDYWLLRMYPVPGVEYYRLPVPDLTWQGELSKGEILRQLLHTYWLYTQSQPADSWPDQLFGWLPQEFYNGGAADPAWCPNCAGPHSGRVAFGGLRPEQDIGGPRVLVHEIAHNLGAQHAWSPTQREDAACFKAEGADIWVDPDWPYLQTPHTQEVGLDLYSNPPIVYPASAYDVMAYCAQPWISPHTYYKIFNSPLLQPNPIAAPLTSIQPPAESGQTGVLLVSGFINPDGTVTEPEVLRLESSSFSSAAGLNPPRGDDYCLDVQAADQSTLAHHCFDVGFTDVETGLPTTEPSPFFFTVNQIDPQAAAKITVSKNDAPLLTLTPSNHAPSLTVLSPNGGENLAGQQTIVWEAADADGDDLFFDLLFSPDLGQSWLPLAVRLGLTSYTFDAGQLPSTHEGLVRVIASDSFNTTLDESDSPFSIDSGCEALQNCQTPDETEPSLPPTAGFSLQGPATVQPNQIFEVSIVAHGLTEPGLFGAQFQLQVDPALARVKNLQLHPALSLVVVQSIQNDSGQVTVVASRQGQTPALTGDVTLATLTLTAQAEGQLTLTLSELIAGTPDGSKLDLPITPDLSLRISHN